jgi:type II secretory pathway component PulJ
MVTWWVLGIVLFSLALLALVLLSVLVRLGALARAAARTQRQLAGVETLQMSIAHLQERLLELQEHATGVQEEMAARRGQGNRSGES